MHEAYETIGLDSETSWQDAVDMAVRILHLKGKEVDAAFKVIGFIMDKAINNERITKERDPSFDAKTVADTVMNERMIFTLKMYFDLTKPKYFILGLELLNKGLTHGDIGRNEQEHLIKSKMIDEILAILDMKLKESDLELIKTAIELIGNLVNQSSYLLKSILHRKILDKLYLLLKERDEVDITKNFPEIYITLNNGGRDIIPEFQESVQKLAGLILDDLRELITISGSSILDSLDLENLTDNQFLIIVQLLHATYYLTERHSGYTQLFIQQKDFDKIIMTCFDSKNDVIRTYALKILGSIGAQPFDDIIINIVNPSVIEALINFTSSSDSGVVTDSCLFLGNLMIINTGFYEEIVKEKKLLSILMNLLNDPRQIVSFEIVSMVRVVIKLGREEDVSELINQNLVERLIENLNVPLKKLGLAQHSVNGISDIFFFYREIDMKKLNYLIEEFVQLGGVDKVEELLETTNGDFNDILNDFLTNFYDFSTESYNEIKQEEDDKGDVFDRLEYCI